MRFLALDGLRGIAALAVMIYHFTQHNGLHWLGGAWVAVDLFFILSGFVIAHSYSKSIDHGMSFSTFFLVRFVRLGPLYFVGLFAGVIAALQLMMNDGNYDMRSDQLFNAAMLGVMGLPYLNNLDWPFGTVLIQGPIFPLNDPAWSLFFELFVNILFFIFLKYFKKSVIIYIVLISYIVFIFFLLLGQENSGWGTSNFVYGFPRVISEFFLGVLFYQYSVHRRNFNSFILLIPFLYFLINYFQPWRLPVIGSLTIVPMLVIWLSGQVVGSNLGRVCRILGDLSYPIYILHFPIYRLLHQAGCLESYEPTVQVLIASTVSLLAAFVFGRLDEVVRNYLKMKMAI